MEIPTPEDVLVCVICDKAFTRVTKHKRKTCSAECSKALKKQHSNKAGVIRDTDTPDVKMRNLFLKRGAA